MSFRRRTYLELMDSVLTRMIGGVAAESYPFPPAKNKKAPFKHPLENPPVSKITAVYGMHNGEPYQFIADTDYALQDKQVLVWQEKGTKPDKGTTFEVNYLTGAKTGPLNDIHVGSVARTMLEATALEMAGLYAQLDAVYDAGFIDTASGSALDNVVALLGVKRVKAGRNTVTVELTRASSSSNGEITVPLGTRILTADGAIEYETTQELTLLDGQIKAKTPARDLVENNEALGAGQLVLLAKPIVGIEAVTNTEPSTAADNDEADNLLRERAKEFLHGSERGTLGAIRQAIARQNILADIDEPSPGSVRIIFHGGDIPIEQKERIKKAVNDVRPAGILVDYQFAGSPQKVDVELRVSSVSDLLETDLRRVQADVQSAIKDYFAKLPVKSKGSINRIIGLVLELPEVEDVRILAASIAGTDVLDRDTGELLIGGQPTQLGNLIVTDPNLPTNVFVTVSFPKTAEPVDKNAVMQALNNDFAYLNSLNAVETNGMTSSVELSKRQLNFGKFVLALPLPNSARTSLESYDNLVGSAEEVAIPADESLGDYTLSVTLVNESGESTLLLNSSSSAYVLSPFERLTLASAELEMTLAETVEG